LSRIQAGKVVKKKKIRPNGTRKGTKKRRGLKSSSASSAAEAARSHDKSSGKRRPVILRKGSQEEEEEAKKVRLAAYFSDNRVSEAMRNDEKLGGWALSANPDHCRRGEEKKRKESEKNERAGESQDRRKGGRRGVNGARCGTFASIAFRKKGKRQGV